MIPGGSPAAASRSRPGIRRLLVAAGLLALIVTVGPVAISDPVQSRVAVLVGCALVLWLTEVVPVFVPTLALLAAIPLALGAAGPAYRLESVLGWAADPVLALFFGGFALGAAASRHGLDQRMAEHALAWSRHRRRRLLALVMAATAVLSMWISGIAAAALMLAAVRPHLHHGKSTREYRGALLLGVAMAANIGGIATPVGAGPNGIAIAHLAPETRITFLMWMGFALPLVTGMLVLGYFLITRAHRVDGAYQPVDVRLQPLSRRAHSLMIMFVLVVVAWLSEPLHGVTAPVVAVCAAAILFGGGWLGRDDLSRIDWSTLFLIAGGLVLGRLAERSGLVAGVASAVDWSSVPSAVGIAGFVFVSALMGAVVSNTASAALLIPLALGFGLPSSVAVLIAIGTSFGVPFAISSPANAMAYGEGGLSTRDLLRVGVPLMLIGCLVAGWTGPAILQWVGLPVPAR